MCVCICVCVYVVCAVDRGREESCVVLCLLEGGSDDMIYDLMFVVVGAEIYAGLRRIIGVRTGTYLT